MYTTLIVLGGSAPSAELLSEQAQRADLSIAADSGLECFKQANLKPDIATGDFDSFSGDPTPFAKRIIRAPEQDASDFQKALRQVPDPQAGDAITILGGTGQRSDHFLTNLLIVAELWPQAHIAFIDEVQQIYRVNAESALSLNSIPTGRTISLIPLSTAEGVTTSGLHWELRDAHMSPSTQLGQSNVNDLEDISISIKSGTLYVIVNSKI